MRQLAQSRHQPARGEGGHDGQVQYTPALPGGHHLANDAFKFIQARNQSRPEQVRRGCWMQAARATLEQREVKEAFQALYLLADGALGNGQLVCGLADTAQTVDGFKGGQGGKWRVAGSHKIAPWYSSQECQGKLISLYAVVEHFDNLCIRRPARRLRSLSLQEISYVYCVDPSRYSIERLSGRGPRRRAHAIDAYPGSIPQRH